ncbi:V-type ATP synthase subunit A, partial [Candidatus Dependentiae bacterium]|nr:V-type ATP synthase subunit A [Candidatus Dependentiae bacterium]
MNQNQEKIITGKIISINGPIIFARIPKVKMRDLVKIGPDEMLGEIIEFIGDKVVIQVFEDTIGLKPGDLIISTGVPLSVELGPGLLGVTF